MLSAEVHLKIYLDKYDSLFNVPRIRKDWKTLILRYHYFLFFIIISKKEITIYSYSMQTNLGNRTLIWTIKRDT